MTYRKALAVAVMFVMTVAACALEPVKYLDAEGVERSVEKYKVLTGDETLLVRGWYVVKGNVKFTHVVELRGNVNIILTDGCMLDFKTEGRESVLCNYYIAANLSLYSQSQGDNMGTMRLSNTLSSYEVMSVVWLNVYGGNFEVVSGDAYVSNMTLAGGHVKLYEHGSLECGDLIVKSGSIEQTTFSGHVVVYNSLTLEDCGELLYNVKYKGTNDIYVSEMYVVYLNDVAYTGLIPVDIYNHVYSIGIERVGEGGATEVTRLPTTEGAERTGWYTLGGIRLADKPTAFGVYIHDGKKVVVR